MVADFLHLWQNGRMRLKQFLRAEGTMFICSLQGFSILDNLFHIMEHTVQYSIWNFPCASFKGGRSALAFLPVVNLVNPASAFRHHCQSGSAGNGLVRHLRIFGLIIKNCGFAICGL